MSCKEIKEFEKNGTFTGNMRAMQIKCKDLQKTHNDNHMLNCSYKDLAKKMCSFYAFSADKIPQNKQEKKQTNKVDVLGFFQPYDRFISRRGEYTLLPIKIGHLSITDKIHFVIEEENLKYLDKYLQDVLPKSYNDIDDFFSTLNELYENADMKNVYLSPIQIKEQNQNIIIQLITINETEEIIRDPKKYAPYSFDTDKLKKIEY